MADAQHVADGLGVGRRQGGSLVSPKVGYANQYTSLAVRRNRVMKRS